MTLHQLKVFSKVAKLRGFTLAAASLDVSQPSISFVIQSLERELGAKLFEKLGNKVHLTGAGEKLLHHAEEIAAKVEEIRGEMDELKGLKRGKLLVGSSQLAGASSFPLSVEKFKEQYPKIEVFLKIERSDILEKNLLDGEIELAIIGWAPRSPLLTGEPYRKEEIVAFAPPNHPLTKERSVSLKLIAKEPLIAHRKASPIRDMLDKRFAERGLRFTPVMEVDFFGSRDTIKSMVANRMGIGFLSKRFVIGDAEAGRLKVLNVPELRLHRTMYITVHKKRQLSPLVRAFIDFLRHHTGQ